jgi:hypothetical protein
MCAIVAAAREKKLALDEPEEFDSSSGIGVRGTRCRPGDQPGQ